MKKWLVLLSLCLLPLKAHALTAAQIIAEARIYLGDSSNSPTRQQFTDANLLAFVNDGQREANAQNWMLAATITLTVSSGTQCYDLPVDFMAVQRANFGGIKLEASSKNELDSNSDGWGTARGTRPLKYFIDYFPVNPTTGISQRLCLYPIPSSGSVAGIYLDYTAQPVEMTATSQTPWNNWAIFSPYHSSLIYYVVYRAYMAQEDMEKASAYLNDWQIALQIMRTGLYKQPDFNPGMAGRRNQ